MKNAKQAINNTTTVPTHFRLDKTVNAKLIKLAKMKGYAHKSNLVREHLSKLVKNVKL